VLHRRDKKRAQPTLLTVGLFQPALLQQEQKELLCEVLRVVRRLPTSLSAAAGMWMKTAGLKIHSA